MGSLQILFTAAKGTTYVEMFLKYDFQNLLFCEARTLYFFLANLMLSWPRSYLFKTFIIKVFGFYLRWFAEKAR